MKASGVRHGLLRLEGKAGKVGVAKLRGGGLLRLKGRRQKRPTRR